MLNYIDTMLIAKESLNKKHTPNAYLTDDGFPMGLAYLLHILQENRAFESLHWFESMKIKFKFDEDKIK